MRRIVMLYQFYRAWNTLGDSFSYLSAVHMLTPVVDEETSASVLTINIKATDEEIYTRLKNKRKTIKKLNDTFIRPN